MFEVGSIIGGKYRILGELGQGGMSTVYLVVNEKTNKLWAMKKVRKIESEDKKYLKESLQVEIETLKRLKHPNLPSVVEVIEQQQEYLVVMDYIEGISLEKLLEEKGSLEEEEVARYAIQLCDVLSYLHTRKPPVIYRDMKPSNVLVKLDGSIVLIDFGTAREFKENAAKDTNNLGTRGYAAPEQFGQRGQTDARTDIYCLGMTMYHLLTAHNPIEPPYEIYPITKWNAGLSAGLDKIVRRCIQKNPKDRFQTADELMRALLDYREYGLKKKKSHTKKKKIALFMTAMAALAAAVALYLRRKTTEVQGMMPHMVARQANILFVIASVLVIFAIILFFWTDYRRKRIRKKKSKKQVPPPVTIELTPRVSMSGNQTECVLQEDVAQWQVVQDITYVHAEGILLQEQKIKNENKV